jgi:hypothetical protein
MRLVSLPGLCVASLSAAVIFSACGSSSEKKKVPTQYEAGGAGGAPEPTSGSGGKAAGGAGKGGGGAGGSGGSAMNDGGVGGVPLEPQGGAAGATDVAPLGGAGAGGDGNVVTFHGLYVGPTGDDAKGDGTLGKPFASLAKVVEMAKAGDTIVFADGDYLTNNTTFTGVTLPDGVNVTEQTPGSVIVKGSGGTLFNLAGSSRIEGLVTQGFGTAVAFKDDTTATGTVTIVDSKFNGCSTTCLILSGSTKAVITAGASAVVANGGINFAQLSMQASLSMDGGVLQGVGNGNVFYLQDDSSVSLANVSILGGAGQPFVTDKKTTVNLDHVTIASAATAAITLKGQSKLIIKDSDISLTGGTLYHCVRSEMDGVGSISITDSKLHHCGNGFTADPPASLTLLRVEVYDMENAGLDMGAGFAAVGGTFRITDSNFHDVGWALSMGGNFDDIKVRGSQFSITAASARNTVDINVGSGSTVDFGTLAEPGGNTFLNGNVNQTAFRNGATAGVAMTAVGNTWMADLQSADSQGHYVVVGAGAKLLATNVQAGRNYQVPYNGGSLLLAQNP